MDIFYKREVRFVLFCEALGVVVPRLCRPPLPCPPMGLGTGPEVVSSVCSMGHELAIDACFFCSFPVVCGLKCVGKTAKNLLCFAILVLIEVVLENDVPKTAWRRGRLLATFKSRLFCCRTSQMLTVSPKNC